MLSNHVYSSYTVPCNSHETYKQRCLSKKCNVSLFLQNLILSILRKCNQQKVKHVNATIHLFFVKNALKFIKF